MAEDQQEKQINTEVQSASTNLIGNQAELENDQSETVVETPDPKNGNDGGQMMSRRRARALAKQLAAAGIDQTN